MIGRNISRVGISVLPIMLLAGSMITGGNSSGQRQPMRGREANPGRTPAGRYAEALILQLARVLEQLQIIEASYAESLDEDHLVGLRRVREALWLYLNDLA